MHCQLTINFQLMLTAGIVLMSLGYVKNGYRYLSWLLVEQK